MPTFPEIVDAVARVGVPSVALGYCLYALNGTLKEMTGEMRATREVLSALAGAHDDVKDHVTERAAYVITEVNRGTRGIVHAAILKKGPSA